MTKQAEQLTAEEIRSTVKKGFEPLSRGQILVHRAAALALMTGVGIVGGPPAANGIESGVNAAGNAIESGVNAIGNINDASHNAAAGHSDVPSSPDALTREAQQTIQDTETGTAAREQLQP